jgi:hypothetical protein
MHDADRHSSCINSLVHLLILTVAVVSKTPSHVAWERSHGAGGSGSIGDFGDRNGKEAGMYIPTIMGSYTPYIDHMPKYRLYTL